MTSSIDLFTKGRPNCWHSNFNSYAGNVGHLGACVAIWRRFGRTNWPSAPSRTIYFAK
jgi:hypothetical protein